MSSTTPERARTCSLSYDVLASDGWLSWNERIAGLTAERLTFTIRQSRSSARLETVLYSDSKGRVRMPSMNPYVPVRFTTPSKRKDKVNDEWIELATAFADDLLRRRIDGGLVLDPSVGDVRPFLWAGLIAAPRYTYTSSLPHPESLVARSTARRVAKCEEAGFSAELTDDAHAVARCLDSTADRKGYRSAISVDDLELLKDLLGDALLMHVGRDTSGRAVSGGIRVGLPGRTVLGIAQGTATSALSSGIAQLVQSTVLSDATRAGFSSYDYGGANIRAVAAAKSRWGMTLTPYFALYSNDTRAVVRRSARALIGEFRDSLLDLTRPSATRENRNSEATR